ncbi:MAG: hypothetical protein KGD73_04285 [Candidatus Lokiarchaeota archaeon]|nr:hypothetical protein [Candidatus Lokiarchaeota archaeon]
MFLDKLKEVPKNLYLIILFVGGFILFLAINTLVFQAFSTSSLFTTHGILDFEFAWTVEQIELIFTTWGSTGMAMQESGVIWDFIYIIGYVSFAFGGILFVTRKVSGNFQKVGLYVSFIAVLSGLFDVIENIFLLIMLQNSSAIPTFAPPIAGIMATIKFTCLAIALLYFVTGLVVALILTVKKK